MEIQQGLERLDETLREHLKPDSEEYQSFQIWRSQLLQSVEEEERSTVLGTQASERRERVLRNLDKLTLRYAGVGFLDMCLKREQETVSQGSVYPRATRRKNEMVSRPTALLVGVSHYVNPLFPNLPASSRDVTALSKLLADPRRGWGPKAIVQTIAGKNVTAKTIRQGLQNIAKTTRNDSTVLVYFSGHGGRGWHDGVLSTYLCPSEADPDDLDKTAISGKEFSDLVMAIKSVRTLIILDACHASGSADVKSTDGKTVWKAGLSEAYYEELSRGAGKVVIASCSEEQLSYVRDEGDLSVFTWHLCRGLQGDAAVRGDGFVYVLDLFHFVSESVQKEEPRQSPILKVANLNLDFAVMVASHQIHTSHMDKGGTQAVAHHIRQKIIENPSVGAELLSKHLAKNPNQASIRNEVDLKRTQLEELQRNEDLFGATSETWAKKSQVVFSLLRACALLDDDT